MALAATASWADGELDSTFGTNGVVNIAFPNTTHAYLYGAQKLASGTVKAAGFEERTRPPGAAAPYPELFIWQLPGGGTASANSYTQTALNGPSGVVMAPNLGDTFVSGSNADSTGLLTAGAAWLNPSNGVSSTYARVAAGVTDQSACLGRPILDKQGRIVASCFHGDPSGTGLQLAAVRLIANARYNGQVIIGRNLIPDPAFGINGFSTIATFPAGYTFAAGTAIAQDSNSGEYYLAGFACAANCLGSGGTQTVAQFVARLNGADGSLDTAFGTAGFAVALAPTATGGSPQGITVDSSGNVVVAGSFSTAGSPSRTGYVTRLTSAGVADSSFGTGGVVLGLGGNAVIDVRTDAINRVYVLDHDTRLYRLTASGAADAAFASVTDVQALNGVGSAWQSLQFVDSSQSSAFLVGGASAATGCTVSCATTAVIARVTLIGSASTTTLTSSPNPSSHGQTVNFTATVMGLNPIGTVTFKDGVATLGSVTLPLDGTGTAMFSTSSLNVGTHNVTATYGGDAGNGPSASQVVTQAVTINASATTLTLMPSTSTVGQSIALTATVTGSNPTGTVTFKDGAATLATAMLMAGSATFSTSTLIVGSHAISASYGGDANNDPSTSATVTETVNAATSTTSLAVTPTTVTDGQSVTMTAIVTGASPNGTVTFKDGTLSLGTATLVAGSAAFSTSILSVGSHALTAEYGGDGNNGPSTSAAVTVIVNAKPPPSGGGSGGGGGGGALGLLDLCSALLLLCARTSRRLHC